MPVKSKQFVYWDSCVFLAYVKAEPERIDTLDDLWEEIADEPDIQIVSSAISIIEVAYGSRKTGNAILDIGQIEKIDSIWNDPSILIVELSYDIAFLARDLTRDALKQGWKLKNYDATHLATAMWLNKYTNAVSEIHTYDDKLAKYGAMIGIHICEPHINQHRLPIK